MPADDFHPTILSFLLEAGELAVRQQRDLAEQLAELQSARAVNEISGRLAAAAGYLVRRDGEKAGRQLDPSNIRSCGLDSMLASADLDLSQLPTLADELARYLAGPPVNVWEYLFLDADVDIAEPVEVADGWQLEVVSSNDLSVLVGVPSTAAYVPPRRRFSEILDDVAVLRRESAEIRPTASGRIFFPHSYPYLPFWRPLLTLSLYRDEVVHPVARYVVEPGRQVERAFEDLPINIHVSEDGDEYEYFVSGSYSVERQESARFSAFLRMIDSRISDLIAKERPKQSDRFRRVAERFLMAGAEAFDQGYLFSEKRPNSVFHYVVALEALLAGTDGSQSDLARRVAQRAAILAGDDDTERERIFEVVRNAYQVRSKYAHGDRLDNIDFIPELRSLVRRCILRRLILGDPISAKVGQSPLELHQLLDLSLLHHELLHSQVHLPIEKFRADLTSVDE